MMKNIIYLILSLFPFLLTAQVEQPSKVQSQGAIIESSTGIYTNTAIIGEPISSGELGNGIFAGSSYGFLGNISVNQTPIADAGDDQEDIISGAIVTLDGTGSSDSEQTTLTYQWVSFDGIVLSDPSVAQPTFTAPDVLARKTFRFQLTVSDGQEDDTDEVLVIVTSSEWVVTSLSNTSTFVALVRLDGGPGELGDIVGAFAEDGTARFVDTVIISEGQTFVRGLIQVEGVINVSFKVYDASEDQICDVEGTVQVILGSNLGTPTNPHVIDATCNNCIKCISVKVFLQGPFNGSNLNTSLNAFLQNNQPYNVPPFNYAGTESVVSFSSNVVDWVLLELRSPQTTIIARRAALLTDMGDIVDLDGVSPVSFDGTAANLGTDYYVVVRHRNHLGVMTATTIQLN